MQKLENKPDRAENRGVFVLLEGYHAAEGIKAYVLKACGGDND